MPEPPPYEGPVDIDVLKGRRVLMNISNLRSEVKVKVKRGKKSFGSFKGVLLFEHPDHVRLRVYDPFGSVGIDMVNSYGRLQILVPSEGVLYEGDSPVKLDNVVYQMQKAEQNYSLLALKDERWGTRIQASYSFDTKTVLNTKVQLYDKGEIFIDARFKDFLEGLPLRARFELFDSYKLYLDLIEPEVNVDISHEFFDLYAHGDFDVLPLERLVREGM